ncbi:MAG: hypothetical protein ACLFU4_10290, partial [Opitutales bacterium]
ATLVDADRAAVLAYLAARQGVKQTSATILRRINKENNFTIAELETALAFLEGMSPQLVEHTREDLGSTKYYGITSAGVLHYERNL